MRLTSFEEEEEENHMQNRGISQIRTVNCCERSMAMLKIANYERLSCCLAGSTLAQFFLQCMYHSSAIPAHRI
jgi:hypothetical protein